MNPELIRAISMFAALVIIAVGWKYVIPAIQKYKEKKQEEKINGQSNKN